jgi:hypothetical protein
MAISTTTEINARETRGNTISSSKLPVQMNSEVCWRIFTFMHICISHVIIEVSVLGGVLLITNKFHNSSNGNIDIPKYPSLNANEEVPVLQ